jgi:hypothetical protein
MDIASRGPCTIVFCLFACRPHYPLWKELNAKQFVMKRNKLLRVKKFMIERQMLGDFQNSLSAQPAGHPQAHFE